MSEYRIDPTISYDVVELPSRGIHYESKKKSVKVSHLTAVDENILSAPNLLASSTVVEELLRNKILDKDFNIDDMVEEDRQAVLIFLRNTAFGGEYKINTTDPKTDKSFVFEVDLTILKTKDFTLTEDANGEYSYRMEKSGVDITFKFLNKKQEKELEEIADSWNGTGVPPVNTKKLGMMIKSVQGNKDMMNTKNFIDRLPIKDSQDFKKYVENNKPGLDLTQNVTTPSGENIQVKIGFGVEFFRPFYGI